MRKRMMAWILLLAMCIAGGALAEGGQSWQVDGIGLSLGMPADYTVENLSNGQEYVAELKNKDLGDDIVYQMVATADTGLSGACLDDLDEETLRGLLQSAGGDSNYDCYFDEVSSQSYMVAEKEGGAMVLALTVHDGFACVFSVRSAQGQLSQAAKDGLMAILSEATYR